MKDEEEKLIRAAKKQQLTFFTLKRARWREGDSLRVKVQLFEK